MILCGHGHLICQKLWVFMRFWTKPIIKYGHMGGVAISLNIQNYDGAIVDLSKYMPNGKMHKIDTQHPCLKAALT